MDGGGRIVKPRAPGSGPAPTRLLAAAAPLQEFSQSDVRPGQLRLESRGPAKACRRLRRAALTEEDLAQGVVGLAEVRGLRGEPAQDGLGLPRLTGAPQDSESAR